MVSSTYQDISKGSSSQSDPRARFEGGKDNLKPASIFLLSSLFVLFPPTPFLPPRSSRTCDQAVTAGRMIFSTGEMWAESSSLSSCYVKAGAKNNLENCPQENSLTSEGCLLSYRKYPVLKVNTEHECRAFFLYPFYSPPRTDIWFGPARDTVIYSKEKKSSLPQNLY